VAATHLPFCLPQLCTAGGELLLDDDAADDSEDVADASPISPPEAFDLVLQDVTLNIGRGQQG
jgi:hypothetical protein